MASENKKLNWSLGKIAEITGAELLPDGKNSVSRISIDSRQDVKGTLFVALAGDRFDGHDYLKDVAKKGGEAAVVTKRHPEIILPQIVVDDTNEALLKLGQARRDEVNPKVFAITGSSGKTTTRKMLFSILSVNKNTHQPVKNFNNAVGVPLTMLELQDDCDVMVLELGCSDFGEIEILTKIARPDAALITNVGPAHLKNLGNLKGVKKAKGELFAGLSKNSVSVVNLDDPNVESMPVISHKTITYSATKKADVRLIKSGMNKNNGQTIKIDVDGEKFECNLPVPGMHNAYNALAACAGAKVFGCSTEQMKKGLERTTMESGRLEIKEGENFTIIDDTYNANPESMKAALKTLFELSKGKLAIAVLGDMAELGEKNYVAHLSAGKFAGKNNVGFLVSVGKNCTVVKKGALEAKMPERNIFTAKDNNTAILITRTIMKRDCVILVKGSRSMKMENIVNALLKGNIKDAL